MNGLTKAASDVLAERQRQITAENWTPDHDDEHSDGSLAAAAACYALHAASQSQELNEYWRERFAKAARELWPWDAEDFKPKDARRDLVRATALGLAEIERTDRQGGEPYGVPAVDPAQPFTEPGERRWSRVMEVMGEAMERAVRAFDTGSADDYGKACIAFDDALAAELDRVTTHGVALPHGAKNG